MIDRHRFEVHELRGADDPGSEAEHASALAAARTIESGLSGPDPVPGPDLADRIMAAVGREPAPKGLGIVAALRRRPGLAGFLDSLRVAGDRVLGSHRSLGLRAGAMAYVAAVLVLTVSLSGVVVYGAGQALNLFAPSASASPSIPPAISPPGPLVSPEPSEPPESVEPSESPEPSESAEPTESAEPGETADPTDDHGDHSTAEPTDDHSDGGDSESGSASGTRTPEPTKTPQPSETQSAED